MADFADFAGQLVASGTRPNQPLLDFEEEANATVLANLASVQGLLPKVSKVMVRETRIQDGSLDRYFRKTSLPYGAGMEEIQFATGAANKKQGSTCFPYGNVQAGGQLDLVNFAWNIPVTVWDHEIRANVLSGDELSAYVTQKLRTPYKTLATAKRKSQIQLISDVIDGTRSITSSTESDGSGTTVTYAPNIKGYAGYIEDTNIVMPALVQGTLPAFASGSDVMDLVKVIQDNAAGMMEEGTGYSAMGYETFCLDRPLLIMETRTLNAMDSAWALDGSAKQIPTRTAREFLATFSEIVEIPAFADIPTNASYTDKRLGAVLIDWDSLTEAIQWDNVESLRCVEQRATGYSVAGASIMSVYRGNPACGILFDTQ